MNEFIIQWYSRSILNFQPSEIKQLFGKIETKAKLVITNSMHKEFNDIYIYVYMDVSLTSIPAPRHTHSLHMYPRSDLAP